ncbi:nuclear transport factor 2 family protein [Streptomyces bacillaris]|uniref:nuclear transport factor 2 family protein n=1 Tax=Streptomyces bacillaris TaxID=68179 RepID=UPI00334554B6
MTLPLEAAGQDRSSAAAHLHHQIQGFYARQMRLLDGGEIEAWAETFTPQGVFAANAHPEPVAGRDAIVRAARAARDALDAEGVRRRHWIGMIDIHPVTDDRLLVRSYAMVLEIPRGGPVTVHTHTTCDDTLVHEDGQWRVEHRQVLREDLATEAER